VVDKINNASTGVTAAKNEEGDGIVLTSLQDFTVEDGDPAGLEVLGLDGWDSDTDGVAESANHTIDSLDILTAGNAQIGRASCRERGENSEDGVSIEGDRPDTR